LGQRQSKRIVEYPTVLKQLTIRWIRWGYCVW